MANNPFDKVYLSKQNLQTIADGGTITSGDDSFSADENAIYMVPEEDEDAVKFYLHQIRFTFADEDKEYSSGEYYIDIKYVSTSGLSVQTASEFATQYSKKISMSECLYDDDLNEESGWVYLANINLFPDPTLVELVIHLVGVNYNKTISTLPNTFEIITQSVTEL